MFSHEERIHAIQLFLQYDCSCVATVRKLGYPNKESLRQWCEELHPGARKIQKSAIKLTQNQKENVLKKFYQPQKNRKVLADSEGISRSVLYQWKNTYLGKDFPLRMNSKNEKEVLLEEFKQLKEEVHQLQLEKTLLEVQLSY